MIFVTQADGRVTYVSPEWAAFTGQAAAEAVGHGWLTCMHPDDYETAVTFLRSESMSRVRRIPCSLARDQSVLIRRDPSI